MDKRSDKRLVPAAGLLFLMLLGMLFLCFRMIQEVELDNTEKLGRLVLMDPEKEGDYVSVFQGKNKENLSADREAGERMEEKYGYTGIHKNSAQALHPFLLPMGGICTAIILLFMFISWRKQKTFQALKIETFGLKDRVTELEAEQEILRERMKREETETKSLVTDISHQLKTPLASLKMCYEIAGTSDFTPEEQQSFLMQGLNEVKKLENLTQTLINLSRLEARMIQIAPVSTSLKKTILAAVNGVYMKAFDKNIVISLNHFEDEDILHDPRWTQEALLNVLDNAVKYSQEDTSIEIRVIPMMSYYLIEVEDEGRGISKEEMNEIFKRFYRGTCKEVQESEGSGVGLYLSRKILEEQGGSIRVKKGRTGSVFIIALPKA